MHGILGVMKFKSTLCQRDSKKKKCNDFAQYSETNTTECISLETRRQVWVSSSIISRFETLIEIESARRYTFDRIIAPWTRKFVYHWLIDVINWSDVWFISKDKYDKWNRKYGQTFITHADNTPFLCPFSYVRFTIFATCNLACLSAQKNKLWQGKYDGNFFSNICWFFYAKFKIENIVIYLFNFFWGAL